MSHPHTPQQGLRVSEKFALHRTTTHTNTPTPQKRERTHSRKPPFRCSQPLSTNQTPHPTTKAGQQPEPPTPRQPENTPPPNHQKPAPTPLRDEPAGLLPQDPTVCLAIFSPTRFPPDRTRLLCTRTTPTTGAAPQSRTARTTEPPHDAGGVQVSWCSLERR